jgi:hypothetical protein
MNTTANRYREMPLEALWDQYIQTAPGPGGSTEAQMRMSIQIKLARLQDEAARDLVTATAQLGETTARLVGATWGLVGATFLLVLAEIALKVLGRP